MRVAFYQANTGVIAQRGTGSPEAIEAVASTGGWAVIEIDLLTYNAEPPIETTHRVVFGHLALQEAGNA